MSDGVLDLSLTSYEVNAQRTSRTHDQVSSDSGRASSDSTSSDIHDDIKPNYRTPPPRMMGSPSSGAPAPPSGGLPPLPDPSSSDNTHHPGLRPSAMAFPPSSSNLRNLPPSLPSGRTQQYPHTTISSAPSSSPPTRVGISSSLSNPNSPETTSSLQEEDLKPIPLPMTTSSASADRGSDPRVAPIRPFKMYPVDAFNVYNSQLMPASGSGLSPSHVGIQSLYDSASPSSFSTFPLTPLTSHLLQRKRRAELRENANTSSASIKSDIEGQVVDIVNSSSPTHSGNSDVSTSLSPGRNYPGNQENLSDAEKKAKIVPDEKKDDAYWDRRRKNNEAAKRSRDARRQKEEEIAMRAAFLEQENLKLRAQVAILKNETAKLHYMLYNRI